MPSNISEEVIFFNPVYRGKIDFIDNEKIKNEIYSINKIDSGRVLSNFGGWQSNDIEDKLSYMPETKKLVKEMLFSLSEIYSLWGFDDPPILDNMWININKKNDFNLPHSHPGCKFSSVYYVSTNEDSGKICFTRPDIQGHYFSSGDTLTPYTFLKYSYQPNEREFIFFPSYISHYVEPNNSEYDRISIAFNFR